MNNAIIDEIIRKLVNLNEKLNSEKISNVKLVLTGIEDERDKIIDSIMIDKDVYSFCQEQSEYIEKYYKAYGNVCFANIVDKIIRILLKDFKLYSDIKSPKGYMLSYCFLQGFGTFKNRVYAYFHRYQDHFIKEVKGHVSIDKMLDNENYLDMQDLQDIYKSNKYNFDIEFHQISIDRKDHRLRRSSIKKNFNNNSDMTDVDNFEDENGLLLNSENHPTVNNMVITPYDVPYETLRLNNILLNDKEYNRKINKIRQIKLKKWNRYKNESSMLPYNAFNYKQGVNYFRVRNNKNPDYIQVTCKPKKIDFSYIFEDKKAETYIKNIIAKNLSYRQQLLINFLYYEMLPVDSIVSSMQYANKTALNKEKHRALKAIKIQLLKDYDCIQNKYGETFLWYWTKRIKRKFDRIVKNDKNLLSI